MIAEEQLKLLKRLPSVNKVAEDIFSKGLFEQTPRALIFFCIRASIQSFRSLFLENHDLFKSETSIMKLIIEDISSRVYRIGLPNLRRVVNATGVVVHTNLGRSPLSKDIINNLILVTNNYSNLEFDLSSGYRGTRCNAIEPILCKISGAEAAFVVNNNAGAVLLCLDTISNSKEVIISRGELVEIGGSFRIPDVMLKSGSIIREVGTTNRTHIKDYSKAITDSTGMLLKVHTSNYGIVGFTCSVSLSELVSLGKSKSILVMEDLGSGTFVDFSKYGFLKEPTVQDSIASGVDIVTFSGDKLLGGPQAGIILGKKKVIKKIRENPLSRALRIDKMTLSALEITLKLYCDEKEAIKKIPTLNMLLERVPKIEKKALNLRDRINKLSDYYKRPIRTKIFDMSSCAGGGSLPLTSFPSKCLGIQIDGLSVSSLKKAMQNNCIPIIGRIENNYYILDLRTVSYDEIDIIEDALKDLLVNHLFID